MFSNRKKLIEMIPDQFKNFEHEQELVETIKKIKKWKKQRKWLVANKIELTGIQEENMVNELIKKYDLYNLAHQNRLKEVAKEIATSKTHVRLEELRTEKLLKQEETRV